MIKSKRHLLHVLNIDIDRLDYILSHLDEFYYSFERVKMDKLHGRPKRDANGVTQKRKINSSKGELKSLQTRIYKFLLSSMELPEFFFGGVKGKNNILNARFHQGNKYIFTTDLKSFFPSISHKQVYNALVNLGFSADVAHILTKLSTRNGEIPQGVPTSTLLANIVFWPIGIKISNLAKVNGIKFTIYVDDMTLSSPSDFKNLIPQFMQLLRDGGFQISHKKTFYKTKHPIVTGVVVHNNSLTHQREYNKIRARLKREDTTGKSYKGVDTYLDRIAKA